MLEWFEAKDFFEQIYWIIAIPSTLILLIVLVTTFLGGDTDVDADFDTDADADGGAGFQFFTFKNMIGFFTIFGWTGIGCIKNGYGSGLVLFISIICGLIMMAAMASIFYMMTKMVEEGTMKMKNAIGRTGEVYLPIKSKRGAFGKVQIKIQGSTHELQALTDDEDDLAVGSVVKVVEVIDNTILLVTNKL